MNYRSYPRLLLFATSLIGFITACSSPSLSSNQAEELQFNAFSVSAQSAPTRLSNQPQDSASKPEQNTGTDTPRELSLETVACLTWPTYRASAAEPALLPSMPSGFESGCIFGTRSGDQARLYILRDGIALGRVFNGATSFSEVGEPRVPYVESRIFNDASGFAKELIESGNAMIFHPTDPRACAVNGEPENEVEYNNRCDFASPHRAYSFESTRDQLKTACFGVNCIETYGNLSHEELLALWEPWWAPTPNPKVNAVRSQYKPMDLNAMPSEFRQANYRFQVEALLRQKFGRTTLGEGEQPSVISEPNYTGKDYSYLNVITVTNRGMADDSIGGYRYRFEFDSFDGDTMILVWAGTQQFCRRTKVWTNQPCP